MQWDDKQAPGQSERTSFREMFKYTYEPHFKTLSQHSLLTHALLLMFTCEFSRHDSGHDITQTLEQTEWVLISLAFRLGCYCLVKYDWSTFWPLY